MRCNKLALHFTDAPPAPTEVRGKVTPEKALPSDQIVELTWKHSMDGKITSESRPQFLVEMREEKSDRWVSVSLGAPLTDTIITIPLELMEEGHNYVFRVAAKNKAGTSRFSDTSPRVQKRKLEV